MEARVDPSLNLRQTHRGIEDEHGIERQRIAGGLFADRVDDDQDRIESEKKLKNRRHSSQTYHKADKCKAKHADADDPSEDK